MHYNTIIGETNVTNEKFGSWRSRMKKLILEFEEYLTQEEKSSITIEKYLRDVRKFLSFVGHNDVTKEIVIEYKKSLIESGYAIRSINSMLASLNSFLSYAGWADCKVKSMKTQRQIYCAERRELTKAEYMRLLHVARKQARLYFVLQTICGTGIRVSELSYFTVEAVQSGEVVVCCKNKTRTILLPGKLRKALIGFAKQQGIHSGIIFRTKNGKPLNRSNIWSDMKKLCEEARVSASKVFPHNLRKLFAKTFYKIEKDIAKLADILGHGSIDTTRIYIMTTGIEHRKKIEQLGLVV